MKKYVPIVTDDPQDNVEAALNLVFVADLRLPVDLALLVGVQLLERSPDHSEHIVLERRDQPAFHIQRR